MAVLVGGRQPVWSVQVKQALVQVQIGSGPVMKSGPLSYFTIKCSHFLDGPHVLMWTVFVEQPPVSPGSTKNLDPYYEP